jgi:hypothetical protein
MIVPSTLSVYRFCQAYAAPDGRKYLTDIQPFPFEKFDDTTEHVVVGQQRIEDVAAIHYQAYGEEAYLLWHVLAAFQPEPILDPTVPLTPGSTMFIPSLRVIEERVFSEDRRLDYEGG